MRSTYGADNVTLVDAGDAVQGKAMGTLTNGEYLIDVMNECGYDFAIPGNHEFDYGMTQFNTLVARANAKYLSCNFTDLRTGNLMFDAYAMREYDTGGKKGGIRHLHAQSRRSPPANFGKTESTVTASAGTTPAQSCTMPCKAPSTKRAPTEPTTWWRWRIWAKMV
ncbi:MAG: hypothetical protein ACLTMP_07545 [Eggerthella lenta]